MEKEINDLIVNNYSAAKLIESHILKVEEEAVKNFLSSIKKNIDEQLGEEWECTIDNDLNKNWSGIKLTCKTWDGIFIRFIGDPKFINGLGIYGIAAHGKWWDRNEIKNKLSSVKPLQDGFSENIHWPYYKYIDFKLESKDQLCFFHEAKRNDVIKEVSKILVAIAKESKDLLSEVKQIVSQ